MTTEALTHYGKSNPLIEDCEFEVTAVSWAKPGEGGTLVTESASETSEASDARGRMVLEGIVQRYDTVNQNKRVYPRSLWEKLLAENSPVMQKVSSGRMIGHLEHPESGVTNLKEAAIIVKALRMNEDKTIWGRVVVLNTPAGQIVRELVEAGAKPGISSRGTGSVDSKGVVQEDYCPSTWDIVDNPSTPGAFMTLPKPKNEATKVQEATVADAAPDTKNAADALATEVRTILADLGMPVLEDYTGLNSVEQDVNIRGLDYIRAKAPNIKDANSLAMVFIRFRKWAKQRGAVDRTIDAAWDSFAKINPVVTGTSTMATDDKGPGAVPAASKGAEQGTVPAVEMPKATTAGESVVTTTATADASKLVAEARAALARLTEAETALKAQVATLTETNTQLTRDLETSRASSTSLQAKVDEQRVSLDNAARTLAALTAVDTASQVREAVEEAIRKDSCLAAFRESLEAQKDPHAVETKAKALVEAVEAEARKKTPAKAPLGERLRVRASVNESRALPAPAKTEEAAAKPVQSEDDAGKLDEEQMTDALPPMRRQDRRALTPRQGAKAAASAIARLKV